MQKAVQRQAIPVPRHHWYQAVVFDSPNKAPSDVQRNVDSMSAQTPICVF